ncbi:MAG: hypothetical protein HZC50_02880, partial [Nitrospirae bacterium]|nr:hypothetical protein [Nitrospirota bacterium]
MESKETAGVCLYGEHLARAFHEFCRVIWPGSSREIAPGQTTPASQANTGPASPPDAPTFVFLKDEKIVGHVTTIPVRLSIPSGVKAAHWIVGFMVLPEYRSGYLRVMNARGVLENIQPSTMEAVSAGGRNSFVRPYLKSRLVRLVGSAGLALGQRLWLGMNCLARPKPIQADLQWEEAFDDSYTHLWQSMAGQLGAALVRDRAALESRYGRKIEGYRLLTCRRDEKLLGYCIVKFKQFLNDRRMGDMKLGTIVDCLYDPRESSVLHGLVAHVAQWARQEGVDALLCTASLKSLGQGLLRNGFFKIPGNLNFAYHSRSPL